MSGALNRINVSGVLPTNASFRCLLGRVGRTDADQLPPLPSCHVQCDRMFFSDSFRKIEITALTEIRPLNYISAPPWLHSLLQYRLFSNASRPSFSGRATCALCFNVEMAFLRPNLCHVF